MRSSKMRVFSVDRNLPCVKFPTGFTYRNLHGFARFPGDSTALVIRYSKQNCSASDDADL